MKKILLSLAVTLLSAVFIATTAFAAEEAEQPEKKRAKMLFGQPVNVNTAGGGTLPEGKALTILNASFYDKTRSKRGGDKLPDAFNQVWLLKLRYGITNHLEASLTTPYINVERSGKTSPKHLEGLGDQVFSLVLAPWNEHQGDPFSMSFTAGVLLPTAPWGKNHIPGSGAWGGRAGVGIGKFVTKDIKMDTEVIWSAPFERGNQKVKRGDQYQWNTNMRYLFTSWDIGLESTWIHQESGDRNFPTGNKNLKNGYTEWFVGPSVNLPIDSLGMWAGAGVFFPVLQDTDGPAKVEDARFEFKIGKLW